jgi:hypothetical protein
VTQLLQYSVAPVVLNLQFPIQTIRLEVMVTGFLRNLLHSDFDRGSAMIVPSKEHLVTLHMPILHPSLAATSPMAFATVVDSLLELLYPCRQILYDPLLSLQHRRFCLRIRSSLTPSTRRGPSSSRADNFLATLHPPYCILSLLRSLNHSTTAHHSRAGTRAPRPLPGLTSHVHDSPHNVLYFPLGDCSCT